MRLLLALAALAAVVGGFAQAEKLPVAESPLGRTSCELMVVTYDWDFATSSHGFEIADCDQSGIQVWEYGETGNIPDPPDRVWGTILESDYLDESGSGLVSPTFVVGPDCWFVQLVHYFVTEPGYDGANVSIGLWPANEVIEPLGGYPYTISENPSYYAHCVDGEPGWSGSSDGWRVDCFDLSEFIGQEVVLEFDFGSDESLTDVGWYLAAVRVGIPEPPEGVCCFGLTGDCEVVPETTCLEQGGEWHSEWESCDPNPCPVPPYEPRLQAGPWINAEPWHDYIPLVPGEAIEVTLDLPSAVLPPEQVASVEFYYSSDLGASWELLGVDEDGYQLSLSTVDSDATPRGNGWGVLTEIPDLLPAAGDPAVYRAVVNRLQGPPSQYLMECTLDPAPPELVTTNIEDWYAIQGDSLLLEMYENGCDVEVITVFFLPKFEEFVKGVPGIWQRSHSDWHCVPAATAQCLKYFEQALGDLVITSGLSDFALVDSLAVRMATNQYALGTSLSDWKAGLADWIQDHGAGYSMRVDVNFLEDGTLTWTPPDWPMMRNELERGLDVLVGICWETGGGHAMTLEAVVNTPLPNGRLRVGFKDPWTAQTEWGELDPQSGWIWGLTGAGGGTGWAYVAATVIVGPLELEIDWAEEENVAYRGPIQPEQAIPITVPTFAGSAFMHIIIQSAAQHARLLTRVVTSESSALPETQEQFVEVLFLEAPGPNPFHDATVITYGSPRTISGSLSVFDVTGRSVRTLVAGLIGAGRHQITWDGRDDLGQPVGSGVYYARLIVDGRQEAQRLMLLR